MKKTSYSVLLKKSALFVLAAFCALVFLSSCEKKQDTFQPQFPQNSPPPPKDMPQGAQGPGGRNPVIETIMSRRAVRDYDDKPVEHEKLEQIVECGIYAPNGMNAQSWAIRVVENQSFIDELTEIFKEEQPQLAQDNFKTMFRNARTVICVATPKDNSALIEAGMLGENMILAAQSLGLKTCPLGGPAQFLKTSQRAKPYLDALNIPPEYELNYMIAIGYSDEKPEVPPRDKTKIEYIR